MTIKQVCLANSAVSVCVCVGGGGGRGGSDILLWVGHKSVTVRHRASALENALSQLRGDSLCESKDRERS